MQIPKKAYINNFDLVCCAGNNPSELFRSICEKKDTISIDNTYVKDKTLALGKINSSLSFYELLLKKVNNVLQASNLQDFSSTLLVIGSSVGGMKTTEDIFFKDKNYKNIKYKEHTIDSLAYFLKKHFSFYDDISFSTACTSSANALGYAKEVIEKKIYKNVLVLGADSLCHTTVCGFSALGVLSSKTCTPFDINREGMNVSEAIAVLLLQDHAQKNAIELCGVGYSSDAHHMSQPHPDGLGAKTAMQNAIKNANLQNEDIHYINAHGTGTQANDNSEIKAIKSLFQDQNSQNLYISSSKSTTGHTLGAAGATEAIISSLVLLKQTIIPNKNLKQAEFCEMNFPLKSLEKEISYVMSNSFAFGGNNTSLIFGLVK